MGFADEEYADNPYADDAPQAVPTPRAVVPPWAIRFDGETRDVPINATTGLYAELHPVDHAMAIAVGLAFGRTRAVPTVGSTLHEMQISTSTAMSADARRRVERAAADLLRAGDVKLVEVVAGTNDLAPGRVRYFISYRNLRLPPEEQTQSLSST